MIDMIKSSFEQHLKFLSLSAYGELTSDEENASDNVSFFCISCLQNFKFPSVDSIALICSSRTYA